MQGGVSITLLDTLDAHLVFNATGRFRHALTLLDTGVTFDVDSRVHVFELTIRCDVLQRRDVITKHQITLHLIRDSTAIPNPIHHPVRHSQALPIRTMGGDECRQTGALLLCCKPSWPHVITERCVFL